jgi:hypothetical protein
VKVEKEESEPAVKVYNLSTKEMANEAKLLQTQTYLKPKKDK